MSKKLNIKMRVLISGSTSGIGLSIAKHYLKQKKKVYCMGRNFYELNKFVKANKLQKFCYKINLDFKKKLNYKILKKISKLDKIVISSGFVKNNLIKFFNPKLFDELINVNLTNPVKFISNLYAKEKINHNAQVVFVASILGRYRFMPGTSAYAIAKAGIIAATKSFALEMAEKNISVNAIAPGMVETDLVKNAIEISKEQINKDKKKYLLGKKYISVKEVKSQILNLLSKSSKRVTGQVLILDAGLLLK